MSHSRDPWSSPGKDNGDPDPGECGVKAKCKNLRNMRCSLESDRERLKWKGRRAWAHNVLEVPAGESE